MGCFVPGPIAQSAAEAESNAQTVTCMKVAYIKQILMAILHDEPSKQYTVPLITDSTASIAMSQNMKDTKRTKHIEQRWQYVRQCALEGQVRLHHIDGDLYQLADLGTKNVPSLEAAYKLSMVEVDTPDEQKENH
jgi:hypothetical protein